MVLKEVSYVHQGCIYFNKYSSNVFKFYIF